MMNLGQVKRRILMGTYALSAGYYDAFYKRSQQVCVCNLVIACYITKEQKPALVCYDLSLGFRV
jgi:Asp-tRNA(Asn)/Glu-tRNA(Gln) amidotransferase A subunit family amidase